MSVTGLVPGLVSPSSAPGVMSAFSLCLKPPPCVFYRCLAPSVLSGPQFLMLVPQQRCEGSWEGPIGHWFYWDAGYKENEPGPREGFSGRVTGECYPSPQNQGQGSRTHGRDQVSAQPRLPFVPGSKLLEKGGRRACWMKTNGLATRVRVPELSRAPTCPRPALE